MGVKAPSRRFAILYSNVPNPITLERYHLLSREHEKNVGIIYVDRQRSKISVPPSAKFETFARIKARDTRGISIVRLSYIFGVVRACRTNKLTDIYAIYPDMLLAAILYKITKPRARIYYEIQDLNEVNLVLRVLHNLMMTQARKIFLTSPGFKREFIPPLSKILSSRAVYISNCPDSHLWGISPQKHVPRIGKVTIGFIGMLRDVEHLETIKAILSDGRYKVLQAGVTTFDNELEALLERYPHDLSVLGPYRQSDLYKKIYPSIDICWCVYPDTINYRWHIARRFNESVLLGLPVIVSSHAREMIKIVQELNIGWILSPSSMPELLSQINQEIDKFSYLDPDVRSKFDLSQYYDVVLGAVENS